MPDPRTPFRRLHRSLRRHGAAATLRRIGALALRRRNDEAFLQDFVREQDGTFDQDFNVDTGGFVKINELETVGKNRADAGDYQATSSVLFREMMAKLDIDFPSFTFVDIGSGKGRAVLLAAAHPFRRVIGIEFAPELCEVARRNLVTYTGPRLCEAIEIVCTDVDAYALPAGPTIFFLYNPFAGAMMERFAEKVLHHCAQSASPAYVLYCNPEQAQAFEAPGFANIASVEGYRVYRVETRTPAATLSS